MMGRLDGFRLLLNICLLISGGQADQAGQAKQIKMINLDRRAQIDFPSDQDPYTTLATLVPSEKLSTLPQRFVLCLREAYQ